MSIDPGGEGLPAAVDVLVIGSGIAGSAAALAAADAGAEVLVLTKESTAEESNTWYAQGGIIYRGLHDSPDALLADILAAGGGLVLESAARLLAEEGPRLVRDVLIDRVGVPFDRDGASYHLVQEAAHSAPRILHRKDHTGRAIEEPMTRTLAQHPRIQVLTRHTVVDLLTTDHHARVPALLHGEPRCLGAYVLGEVTGRVEPVRAREVILATGGLGRLYLHTTNPPGARGDGLAMANRAGARLINLPFIQFHPTALYHPSGRFLLSEALRGEGARLLDPDLQPFMERFHHDGTLAPRDVVARAIHQVMLETGSPHVWLDISHRGESWVREHFPDLCAMCDRAGLDLSREPVPVVPAAHYSCGGIAVDHEGQTSLRGLRAVGEVSCTGVHGANRLASTSLLEGLVWGTRAGKAAAETGASGAVEDPPVAPWRHEHEPVDPALVAQDWNTLQHTMWNYVGLVRNEKRLVRAGRILAALDEEVSAFYAKGSMSDALVGLRHGVRAARLVARAALKARYSLGCHFREDG
ncbi:MAG: L-aspartate oxidase [Candidatus Sericytochromatia bacterium]|nr:L-aspartate oxidase [Candidatus Sericytochromatia bacterium]